MSAIDGVSSARTQSTGNTYDAVFTDKTDNATLKASDFLNLMIAQMKNQDFMNPMDDTQFVTQMAQFSTMQQMQELASYSKSNYAMSLVGKTVTASRFTVSGGLDTSTGPVEKISLVDNEYILYIQGKSYTLSQIMEVQASQNEAASSADSSAEANAATGTDSSAASNEAASNAGASAVCQVDPSGLSVVAGVTTQTAAVVVWPPATEDETLASQLTYTVYYSKDGPFDTLEAVKQGAISGQADRQAITVATIAELEPSVEYYVNIIVKDQDGGEAVYRPVKIQTQSYNSQEG
jgi:flagellar hook assembly protein FlgD